MKRALRIILAILSVAIICEAYFLWYAAEPSLAQTPPFLGRPYYGPAVSHNAQFDHHLPVYEDEDDLDPSAVNKMMRNDGVVYNNASLPICVWNYLNACYSGHDARDFALSYKPVVSAAQGIVQFAGWASTNHTVGLGLYIVVDHNSATFRTYYGHLSAVRYQPTTSVGRWQIGTSGTTGNSSAPHLHFAVSVKRPGHDWAITDPYDWTGQATDPWSAQQEGTPSEWLWLPEPDRTIAAPVRGQVITIDNGDIGTDDWCNSGNEWQTAVTIVAIDNDLRYRNAHGLNFDCHAVWGGNAFGSQVSLPSTGLYEVEVHIPAWDNPNHTRAARYTINFQGGANTVVVDQSRIFNLTQQHYSEWISLGRYTFSSGSQVAPYVNLRDNSYIGTFVDLTSRKVVADAIRLVKSH